MFAPDLGPIFRRLDDVLERTGESEEKNVYLVGLGGVDVNLKIRDARLEVKRLVALDHGLEQWRPDAPARFPLSPAALAAATGLEADTELDLPGFMHRVLRPSGPATAVHVLKCRTHYEGEGVLGETCRLVVNGAHLESVAAEGEDPRRVGAVLAALGLDAAQNTGDPNTSYPRALAWLTGTLRLPPDSPWRAAGFG